MKNIILIVQGTRQKQSIKENPGNRFKTVGTELYSIIKGLFITILGGLVVLYLAGLVLI